MKKLLQLGIVSLAFLALWVGGAGGAVVCVDNATDLLNELVTAAGNTEPDTIQVAQGTYNGNFAYNSGSGYSITLEGGYVPGTGCTERVLDPANTVLDGGNVDRVLFIDQTDGGDISVEGFTIQNGYTDSGDGGGVYARSYAYSGKNGDITFTKNTITGNTADGHHGGGVYARAQTDYDSTAGTVTFTNNTITGNTAEYDGALRAFSKTLNNGDSGDVIITGNTITGNTCTDSYVVNASSSAGYAFNSGDVTITNNTISGNTAASTCAGVFARTYSSTGTAGDVILVNNIITDNTADYYTGVDAWSQSGGAGTPGTVILTNNTVTRNTAHVEVGGVCINMEYGSTNNLYNNIMWGNTAPAMADLAIYDPYNIGTANGYNNDFDPAATFIPTGWDSEGDNINIDPQFIDPDNGDYRLQSDPTGCIDKGHDSPPEYPSTDFEGDTRKIGAHVDIGADEVSIKTWCVADAAGLTDALSGLSGAESNGKSDVIMVQQGTYTGNFSYNPSEGYDITLLGGYTTGCDSRVIEPANTVLDGGNVDRVLYLANTFGGDVFVEGFTMQNGNTPSFGGGVCAIADGPVDITFTQNIITGNTSGSNGGGIYANCISSTVTLGDIILTQNIITGNTSGSNGGGIYANSFASFLDTGNVTLTNNTITENTAASNGGAVYAQSASYSATTGTITLTDNVIMRNTADSNFGGVYATSNSNTGLGGAVIITNNKITGNRTDGEGGGLGAYSQGAAGSDAVTIMANTIAGNYAGYCGGVYASSQSSSTAGAVSFVNNIITGNRADVEKGGVEIFSHGDVTLTNNTVTENTAASSSTGGGVYVWTATTSNFYNNIIWGNTAPTGGDIYLDYAGTAAYGFNNDYSEMIGSWTGGSCDNIDIDPEFIDPDHGDYRLRSSSGCKDEGLNSAPELPDYDFEGDDRIIDTTVDIGADEVSITTTCVSDATELQNALTAAGTSGKGDVIMVEQGTGTTYSGNFTYNSFQGYNLTLLGGYTSGCASRVRNPANTVLDGNSSGSVLAFTDSGSGDTLVDGFTIQHGVTATSGGGIAAQATSSDPAGNITIANNIIKDNDAGYDGGGVFASSYSTGDAGDVTLANNIITGNTAGATRSGGGVDAGSFSNGGGLAGTVTLINNTITDNTADVQGGGAALSAASGGTGTINCYNNIIRGNTATSGGDISLNAATTNGYNNNYATISGSWDYGAGTNINLDPLFVNAGAGDYHLLPGSPCIDTGTNAAPSLPTYDFEGDDRIIDGDDDDTDTVDIGADEYVPIEEIIILHKDGALWSTDTGWTLTSPPYYAGSDYARDLEFSSGGNYLILHKDGALYDSGAGWTMSSPPYYAGSNYAVDMEVTATDADCILDRDGALWYSDTGWVLTSPPYYAGSDYARALELRADTSYVILHQYGGLYDSASGWIMTSPPYYAGSAWVVDMKLEAGGYVLLHQDGALWSTSGGWVLTSPPYYAGSGYARALELVGNRYILLHKDGALYDAYAGWTLTSPPYYSGSNYAVDLEVQ